MGAARKGWGALPRSLGDNPPQPLPPMLPLLLGRRGLGRGGLFPYVLPEVLGSPNYLAPDFDPCIIWAAADMLKQMKNAR